MELDPDDVFKDEDEDPESEFFQVSFFYLIFFWESFSQSKKKNETLIYVLVTDLLVLQEKEASKEFLVYLIDASPKMFSSTCPSVSMHENYEIKFYVWFFEIFPKMFYGCFLLWVLM